MALYGPDLTLRDEMRRMIPGSVKRLGRLSRPTMDLVLTQTLNRPKRLTSPTFPGLQK